MTVRQLINELLNYNMDKIVVLSIQLEDGHWMFSNSDYGYTINDSAKANVRIDSSNSDTSKNKTTVKELIIDLLDYDMDKDITIMVENEVKPVIDKYGKYVTGNVSFTVEYDENDEVGIVSSY